MTVYRCPIYIPRKVNGIKKIIHYLSFLISSFPLIIISLLKKPDVIFTVCPTILSAPNAILMKFLSSLFFKKKVFTWLHIQDFEIEAAFKLNILIFLLSVALKSI